MSILDWFSPISFRKEVYPPKSFPDAPLPTSSEDAGTAATLEMFDSLVKTMKVSQNTCSELVISTIEAISAFDLHNSNLVEVVQGIKAIENQVHDIHADYISPESAIQHAYESLSTFSLATDGRWGEKEQGLMKYRMECREKAAHIVSEMKRDYRRLQNLYTETFPLGVDMWKVLQLSTHNRGKQ